MPFTYSPRGIAVTAERFGDGDFLEGEGLPRWYIEELLKREIPSSADPIGHIVPGRILACQDAGAGWGTDMAGSIGIGELDALLGKAINVGSFIETTSITAQISPPQVVDEKEDDVGTFLSLLLPHDESGA